MLRSWDFGILEAGALLPALGHGWVALPLWTHLLTSEVDWHRVVMKINEVTISICNCLGQYVLLLIWSVLPQVMMVEKPLRCGQEVRKQCVFRCMCEALGCVVKLSFFFFFH